MNSNAIVGKPSTPPINGLALGKLTRALDFGPWPQGIVPVTEEFRKDSEGYFKQLRPAQSHPYTDALHIPPTGALLEPSVGNLVLPLRNILGRATGAWIIPLQGDPFYPDGTELIGNGLLLGSLLGANTLGICVDWPSGVLIHRATKSPVLVTFEHRNLRPVVDIYRRLPLEISIYGERGDPERQTQAGQIARDFGCQIVLPDVHHRTFLETYLEHKRAIGRQGEKSN